MSLYRFIISSAAAYAASFFVPTLFWWSIFIFLLPLFFVRFATYTQAVQSAFFWSVVAYSPHLLIAAQVIHDQALVPTAYLLFIIAVLIFFVPTALWFCVVRRVAKYSSYGELFFITALLHTWWIHNLSFIIMGCMQGYPLSFPLLPVFSAFPSCMSLCYGVGKFVVVAFVYAMQLFSIKNRTYAYTLLGLLVGWYGSVCLWCPQKKNSELICSVSPAYYKGGFKQLAATQNALQKAGLENPQADVYVLPESAIPFDYRKLSYLPALLTDDVGIAYKKILCGTQYTEDNKTFNCLTLIQDSRITVGYVKKHLVPFFEYNFLWAQKSDKGLFLHKNNSFYPGKQESSFLYCQGIGYCRPLICSEAVWHFPIGQPFCVVAAMHDGHFKPTYIKKLIRVYVTLQAIIADVPLVYSSYAHVP